MSLRMAFRIKELHGSIVELRRCISKGGRSSASVSLRLNMQIVQYLILNSWMLRLSSELADKT